LTIRRFAALATLLAGGCSPATEPLPTWTEPAAGIEMVRLPAGRFIMGSPQGEPGREEQERQHEVTLTRPFWIGRFEITQGQWQALMGENSSRFGGDPRLPVEQVNALEIDRFLGALEAASPGERFRLPTEAEWEYACRAGAAGGPSPADWTTTDEANYDGRYVLPGQPRGEYRGRTTAVGSFAANAWGLHDLLGNVWEWTADEHCPYPDGADGADGAERSVSDPLARCGAELRVIRGGSWYFGADSARCALRYTHRPVDRGPSLGLRVVREDPAARGAAGPPTRGEP
jgi:formylglycine-generating enzyme required for sulfatase activity